MKILFITVRSDFGGGPRHVDQLIDSLPSFCSIYVACPLDGEPYGIKWETKNKIKGIVPIPFRTFSFKTLLELRSFIIENRIDIIHSHGNGAGIYSRLLKLLCPNKKVIHTFHGISDNYSSKIKCCMSYVIGWLLSPLANKYVAVSMGEQKMAIHRHFSKRNNTVVIYNGIKDIKGEPKTQIHYPLRVVTLSRFDYQKNMDSFYRIALALKNMPIEFIWVGDGLDRERLEMKSKQENVNIKFIGFSNTPIDYLIKSDWYMSTSRFEGLPYALIEAASIGLPIIASDVKGNNEVAIDGFNGFLYKSEDQAIELLKQIVNDDINYKGLSINSIKMFKENFSESKMINELLMLYQSV